MEKLKSLLTSKKFWTLVAAIVAALTAFFTTSCAASAKVQRHGVHIDTVRVDYIIRSRNIQTAFTCPTNQFVPIRPLLTPTFFLSIPAFVTSTESVMTTFPTMVACNGDFRLTTPPWVDCRILSSLCNSTRLISFITPTLSSSAMAPQFSSRPTCPTFGEKCLALFLPTATTA